jgi:hypothetical protein
MAHLPSYIYRMIDHIYISDQRGYSWKDKFDVLICTTNITHSNVLQFNQSGKTLIVTSDIGNQDQTNAIIQTIKHSTDGSKHILLYSDDYTASCKIFVLYLQKTYHFSNEDITRMITNSVFSTIIKRIIISLVYPVTL